MFWKFLWKSSVLVKADLEEHFLILMAISDISKELTIDGYFWNF